ncbi:MAG TPA: sulfur carrier protein ThiS [Acidimicrobiales bacterium]|nr:sulfur carrier protein ThiS [Acidimicrobiales bacterium]
MLKLEVNGESFDVVPGTTVADLVARWSGGPKGIAVARNREVVPKSRWSSTEVRPGDRVEIVTATAGG